MAASWATASLAASHERTPTIRTVSNASNASDTRTQRAGFSRVLTGVGGVVDMAIPFFVVALLRLSSFYSADKTRRRFQEVIEADSCGRASTSLGSNTCLGRRDSARDLAASGRSQSSFRLLSNFVVTGRACAPWRSGLRRHETFVPMRRKFLRQAANGVPGPQNIVAACSGLKVRGVVNTGRPELQGQRDGEVILRLSERPNHGSTPSAGKA